MSDFDKEAEREKLRKKLARDEQKRAHTQRMSELLLQGATMTNKHCEDCSDPLFRYNDQTFCPSCQAADEPTQSDRSATTEADAHDSPATGSPDDSRQTHPTAEANAHSPPSATAPTDDSLGEARQSLRRTINRFVHAAEQTDDPRRAREQLAAAREAAETLETLN